MFSELSQLQVHQNLNIRLCHPKMLPPYDLYLEENTAHLFSICMAGILIVGFSYALLCNILLGASSCKQCFVCLIVFFAPHLRGLRNYRNVSFIVAYKGFCPTVVAFY